MKSADEFIRGMQDCQAGIPHEDKSPEYTEGYRAQYEREQVAAAQSDRSTENE